MSIDGCDEVESFRGAKATNQTRKALLCVVPTRKGRVEAWVPQSVIHADSEVYGRGHEGVLVVAAWWAQEHGLEPGEPQQPEPRGVQRLLELRKRARVSER